MKELSIEEKAKAYDEAKLRMSAAYNSNRCTISFMNEIFPELKESEDEKIRKRIIHALHGAVLEMSEIKEAVAWLEKQVSVTKLSEEEQNKFAKGVLTSCAMSFINYLDAHKYEGKMCVSNGECEDIENAFHNAMWNRLHRYYCKYIEKPIEEYNITGITSGHATGELAEIIKDIESTDKIKPKDYNSIDPHFCKPIDKVEPKFKIKKGKWYVCTQTFVLRGKEVIIKGQAYQADKDNVIKGEDVCRFIDRHDGEASDYLRSWNIQDAKDGDVLVFKNNIGGIIICKSPSDYDTRSYCRLIRDNLINKEESGWDSTLLVPATKEQRDLLFQKMKEAGYEWDADKKELNKI